MADNLRDLHRKVTAYLYHPTIAYELECELEEGR